jgi:hypothetical protein
MQVQLIVANEQHRGQVIPVNSSSFVIGRSEGCNLRSRSPQVSRYHCTIQTGDATLTVQDLGSENGTFINGNRITSVQTLKDKDTLTVGTHTFTVSVRVGGSKAEKDEFFELPPSTVLPPTLGDGTESIDPSMNTVIMQAKDPDPDAGVMFEVRLDGQRVSVSKSRLFDLARRGSLLPDDLVIVAGTQVFADSIQGIVFGDPSSAPPPPPATLPTQSGTQQPSSDSTVIAPGTKSDPFAFANLGDIANEVNAAAGPVVRIARQESTFSVIWRSLDISFSRVYSIEGNDLVIHSIKALYYVVVVVCLLGIFWQMFYFVKDCIERGDLMEVLSKHSVGLSVVTFGCVTIIVIVRVLLEMLLLSWVESAKQEKQEEKNDE